MSEPPFPLPSEDPDAFLPTGDEALIEAIPKHFEPLFGEVDVVYHEKESSFVHLDLYQFHHEWQGGGWTIVTSGMAEKPMNVPPQVQDPENYRYAELLVHLPEDWPTGWEELVKPENFWPLSVVKSFARLPHERESWVWGGHTLSNGEGFEAYAPDTKLGAAMLCPSYQLPEEFETLALPDGREITFLTLAFLYREEWQFSVDNGSQALFDRANEAGLRPYELFLVDKSRPNLCAS